MEDLTFEAKWQVPVTQFSSDFIQYKIKFPNTFPTSYKFNELFLIFTNSPEIKRNEYFMQFSSERQNIKISR